MIIPYQKYTFLLSVEDEMHLPYYKGSTFRGAFGTVFKKIICTLKQKECRTCLLNSKCIYAYIFETLPPEGTGMMGMNKYEKIPHPFIIEPPDETKQVYVKGENMTFNLVLVGKAMDYLPYFILTFEELGKVGLGRGRGKYILLKVDTGSSTVYSKEDKTIRKDAGEKLFVPGTLNGKGSGCLDTYLALEMITPLRMMYGRKLVSSLEFHILIRNLLRRINLLHYFHCEMKDPDWDHQDIIDTATRVSIANDHMRWHDWERYSSRQETKMKMGGLLGRIVYEGKITPFVPILKAGEVLHAGKGTSFGLGRYRIKTD